MEERIHFTLTVHFLAIDVAEFGFERAHAFFAALFLLFLGLFLVIICGVAVCVCVVAVCAVAIERAGVDVIESAQHFVRVFVHCVHAIRVNLDRRVQSTRRALWPGKAGQGNSRTSQMQCDVRSPTPLSPASASAVTWKLVVIRS